MDPILMYKVASAMQEDLIRETEKRMFFQGRQAGNPSKFVKKIAHGLALSGSIILLLLILIRMY
jgi:hypothetical protein